MYRAKTRRLKETEEEQTGFSGDFAAPDNASEEEEEEREVPDIRQARNKYSGDSGI